MIRKLFFVILMSAPLSLFGQDELFEQTNSKEFKFGVGAAAGFSTGYGLSFRYWPGDWGIQFTTAPYYTKYDSRMSFGTTILRSVKDDDRIKLFVYAGNHILYEKWGYYYDYDIYTPDSSSSTTWILGAGPGFEFTILRKISFNMMFGIASYTEFNKNNENDWMLNMTVETGLYYKF